MRFFSTISLEIKVHSWLCSALKGTITFQWAQTWATLFTFHWSAHGNIPPERQTPQGWHLWGIFCVQKIPCMEKVLCLDPENNKATAWSELCFPNTADQGWLNKPQADWRACWTHLPQIRTDSQKSFLYLSFVLGQQSINQEFLLWDSGMTIFIWKQESPHLKTFSLIS